MSEPYGAFLKLRIRRERLVAWLDSRPRPPSVWSDWSRIEGSWHSDNGPKPLAAYGAAEYAKTIGNCDAMLASYATVRSGLRNVLDAAGAPQLKRSSYDTTTGDFIAGTPAYDENLALFIVFFALARSAAPFLDEDGHGVATVHDYLWGTEEERETVAALRLGPGDRSEFMTADEAPSASAAFASIVDDMLEESGATPSIDQLDALK